MSTCLTVENAQSHVTAFQPISEAARSWSDDNVLCTVGLNTRPIGGHLACGCHSFTLTHCTTLHFVCHGKILLSLVAKQTRRLTNAEIARVEQVN